MGYLMLSSVIGIVIGDLTWLEGLRLLGPRRVIVMDSLKPFLAAVFGWALLDEELKLGALGGIILTVIGILLVSLESEPTLEQEDAVVEESMMEPACKEQQETDKQKENRNDGSSKLTNTPNLIDSSTLSLATGSFSHSASIFSPVLVDEKETINEEHAGASTSIIQHSDIKADEAAGNSKLITPRTNSSKRATSLRETQKGFVMAILNVVLDTYGSVLTKEYGSKFSSWEINLVRFGFAGVVMMSFSVLLQVRDLIQQYRRDNSYRKGNKTTTADTPTVVRDEEYQGRDSDTASAILTNTEDDLWYKLPFASMTRSGWFHVCLGVLFVTFVTPALSNYALFEIALALALTLGSVGPLYALPLTYIMQKDQNKRPTPRACLGAALAVGGIVVLAFLGNME